LGSFLLSKRFLLLAVWLYSPCGKMVRFCQFSTTGDEVLLIYYKSIEAWIFIILVLVDAFQVQRLQVIMIKYKRTLVLEKALPLLCTLNN
jgi:hypothetical protein